MNEQIMNEVFNNADDAVVEAIEDSQDYAGKNGLNIGGIVGFIAGIAMTTMYVKIIKPAINKHKSKKELYKAISTDATVDISEVEEFTEETDED